MTTTVKPRKVLINLRCAWCGGRTTIKDYPRKWITYIGAVTCTPIKSAVTNAWTRSIPQ